MRRLRRPRRDPDGVASLPGEVSPRLAVGMGVRLVTLAVFVSMAAMAFSRGGAAWVAFGVVMVLAAVYDLGVVALLLVVAWRGEREFERWVTEELARDTMDVNDAAAYLGLDRGRFMEAVLNGDMAGHRHLEDPPRFARDELDRWKQQQS